MNLHGFGQGNKQCVKYGNKSTSNNWKKTENQTSSKLSRKLENNPWNRKYFKIIHLIWGPNYIKNSYYSQQKTNSPTGKGPKSLNKYFPKGDI